MAHGDLTGNIKAELAQQVASEQAAKAESLAMATAAVEAKKSDEPIELVPTPVVEVETDGEIELVSVDVEEPKRTFRANTTLEGITVGYGNTYDLVQGQKYVVPESIYNYFDEKGLVWH